MKISIRIKKLKFLKHLKPGDKIKIVKFHDHVDQINLKERNNINIGDTLTFKKINSVQGVEVQELSFWISKETFGLI